MKVCANLVILVGLFALTACNTTKSKSSTKDEGQGVEAAAALDKLQSVFALEGASAVDYLGKTDAGSSCELHINASQDSFTISAAAGELGNRQSVKYTMLAQAVGANESGENFESVTVKRLTGDGQSALAIKSVYESKASEDDAVNTSRESIEVSSSADGLQVSLTSSDASSGASDSLNCSGLQKYDFAAAQDSAKQFSCSNGAQITMSRDSLTYNGTQLHTGLGCAAFNAPCFSNAADGADVSLAVQADSTAWNGLARQGTFIVSKQGREESIQCTRSN